METSFWAGEFSFPRLIVVPLPVHPAVTRNRLIHRCWWVLSCWWINPFLLPAGEGRERRLHVMFNRFQANIKCNKRKCLEACVEQTFDRFFLLTVKSSWKEKERLTAASFFWPFLVTAVNQSFSFPCLLRGVTVREPLAVGRTFCWHRVQQQVLP